MKIDTFKVTFYFYKKTVYGLIIHLTLSARPLLEKSVA